MAIRYNKPVPEVKPLLKFVKKEWGSETWFANTYIHDYCGKILRIEQGKNSSMHYHINKHETFYILSGTLRVKLIDTEEGFSQEVLVHKGETLEIPQGQPHCLIADEHDVTMIEVSTFHRDSDSYRIYR